MNSCTTRTAALVAGDALVLVGLRPRWEAVTAGLAHPGVWLAGGPDAALAAVSGVLLWLAAAWIAVGLVAGLGTRLPGIAGRLCASCVQVVVPRVLLRVVIGSTGLGLLAAPAAHAAPPVPFASAAYSVTQTSTALAATHASNTVPSPTVRSPTVPSPAWPVGSATHRSHTVPAPTPPTSDAPGARVRSGDSLWLLAARRLGTHADDHDVARYWPQVYAANRSVIGDDPSVIQPGQVLDLPAPTVQESR